MAREVFAIENEIRFSQDRCEDFYLSELCPLAISYSQPSQLFFVHTALGHILVFDHFGKFVQFFTQSGWQKKHKKMVRDNVEKAKFC